MAARRTIGNRIAPWRFVVFLILFAAGSVIVWPATDWSKALLIAFDVAALVFLLSCISLLNDDSATMRKVAADNDANRMLLLVVSALLSLVILAAVVGELGQEQPLAGWSKGLVTISLILVWTFANAVYTLHYAHLFYSRDDGGQDRAGLDFPKSDEPAMSDFLYFAFTLAVALQTADVCITSPHIRKVATAHCVIGFFFNLGVLALTVNILGSR